MTIRFWNVEQLRELGQLVAPNPINALALDPQGNYLITGLEKKDKMSDTLLLWDLQKNPPVYTALPGHTQTVTALTVTSCGRYLLSGSKDGTARLWDLHKNPAPSVLLQGHSAEIVSVAFSHDGTCFSTGSKDRTACFWTVNNQLEHKNLAELQAFLEL